MKINAVIHRKENDLSPTTCVVEKTVALTDAQFQHFSTNLLRDHNFIADNVDVMYQNRDGTRHCLLVMGETHPDGILVDSQGFGYARYAAFVPGARDLLALQNLPPDMRRTLEQAPKVADWLITVIKEENRSNIDLEYIEREFDIDLQCNIGSQDILGHVLRQHPEIADVEFDGNVLAVKFYEQKQDLASTPQPGPEMEMTT